MVTPTFTYRFVLAERRDARVDFVVRIVTENSR